MERKLLNIFEFWKSTVLINLAISTLPLLLIGPSMFLTSFTLFGFALSLAIKESKQYEYIFYLNNGISKFRLIAITFVFNFVVGMIATLIFNLISNRIA